MRRGPERLNLRLNLRVGRKIGGAIGAPIANCRKLVALAPKCTPKPRHVWLDTRAPAAQSRTATVVALPVRTEHPGTPVGTLSAAA